MISVSRAARRAVPRAACRLGGAYMHARTAEKAAWHLRAPASRRYGSTDTAGHKQTSVEATRTPDSVLITKGIAEIVNAGRWSLISQGAAIERSFRFKNFTKTWDFMTAVALQCKLKNHHPEWSNVYNTVFVRWTTHSADAGLTIKDVEMAKICDGLGKAFGEVVEGSVQPETAAKVSSSTPTPPAAGDAGPTCKMTSLADMAKGITGGDCCNHTPKNS